MNDDSGYPGGRLMRKAINYGKEYVLFYVRLIPFLFIGGLFMALFVLGLSDISFELVSLVADSVILTMLVLLMKEVSE